MERDPSFINDAVSEHEDDVDAYRQTAMPPAHRRSSAPRASSTPTSSRSSSRASQPPASRRASSQVAHQRSRGRGPASAARSRSSSSGSSDSDDDYLTSRRQRGQQTPTRDRIHKRYAEFVVPWHRGQRQPRGGGIRKAGSDVYDDDEDTVLSRAYVEGDYHRHKNDAGFCDQLFAALDREFRQLLNEKCALAMELIIPLVFIVVTVALWGSWGDKGFGETLYVNYANPNFRTNFATANNTYGLFCYGENAAEPTPGLAPCSTAVGAYLCDGVDTDVPLKGDALCVYAPSFRAVLATFLATSRGNLVKVPTLDSMILYQWSAIKAGSLTRSDTFGGSFITNRQIYAIDKSGLLYLVGTDDTVLQALEATLTAQSHYFPMINGGRFATVADAKAKMKTHKKNWGIVELRAFTATSYDVVIHMSSKGMADTTQGIDTMYSGGLQENGADLYLSTGFLTIAQAVSEFYLEHFHGVRVGASNYVVSDSTPAYTVSPMLRYAYGLIPLIFVLAFLYSVSQQTKKIVLEKETRIREAMLIMGVRDSALHISRFLTNLVIISIVSIVACILVKATFLFKCDIWCLFLFFWLFGVTTIPLAGLIASFFSKARLASLMAPVIYFIIVIPTFVMTSATGDAIIGFAILSPSAFASIVSATLRHQLGSGLAVSDLRNSYDDPQIAVLLVMLAIDFVLYYLLMLYFDAVLPKDWGTPKHPLFFIIDPFKACCCGFYFGRGKNLEGGLDGRAENGAYEEEELDADVVRLSGLRKEYKRGGKKFIAVNNFYWGMRGSEISVLLGHNGAGKTTVLNMMTGMIEPDEGDCLIYGLSIREELSLVRKEIGYCPQHNILWPELSCREHLEFYGRVKGLKGVELEDAVCRMLHETDLAEKMDCKSKDLSGGQKRKLSVSIAFVGGSRLVFLDEPTAGMDVGARRHLWSLLKSMAHFHTIMLTTHFMDEADLLGHRIGIMSQGRLKCSGSSMFLKARLGVGYSVTVSINPEADQRAIDEMVAAYVDNANVLSHNGCELSYQLPGSSAEQFPSLLTAIETMSEGMGIRGYSLSATTLEEVFLKVSEDDIEGHNMNTVVDSIEPVWDYERCNSLLGSQFKAMFAKRFWNALRDRRMQCFQLVCPCVCILVAMLLTLIKFNGPEQLVLDHATVYRKGKADALFPTSQCHRWWGDHPQVAGTIPQETHYANAENLSSYLLDQWFFHREPSYGAVACQDVDLSAQAGLPVANVFIYNGSAPHQSGINMATYYDMIARYATNNLSTMKLSAGILYDSDTVLDPMKMLVTGILIMIPLAFLPSNPVAWIVKERECGALHQQRLAGLNYYIYWICNLLFDLMAYLVAAALILFIFALFQKEEFIGKDRAGSTVCVFVAYGFASTTMAYFISFWFKEHSSAQTATMGGCFAVAFLLLVVTFVLALKPESEAVSLKLRWAFRLVPTYCVGETILNQMLLKQLIEAGQADGAWDKQPVLYSLIYLAVEFPVFALLTLLMDHPTLRRCVQGYRYKRATPPVIPSDEDSDVEEERAAVYDAEADGGDTTDMVRTIDLQKKYPNGKFAVKGVTFSIFPREIFAFLGTNGAGKTTTISMLCHQFMPTGGSASINGYDIVRDSKQSAQSLGFCPQFDATFELLTVEEHLRYYAALHGMTSESKAEVVKTLLRLCELTTYRKTLASRLSGGNRRKLSVAMSLVGGPQVLFLDEPSAGMDPVARRGMWTAIQRASKHCSIVLTTHHLEEVEALADIVSIMVDGTLRCIGDKIHLKKKFGSGFEMSLRILSEDKREAVEAFVECEIPGSVLSEFKGNRFVYELPGDSSLSRIFEIVQANKDALGISTYSISQSSIEQLFLKVSAKANATSDN